MTDPADAATPSSATGATPVDASPVAASTPVDAQQPVEIELVPPAPRSPDWPAQATDTIVNLVDQVRDKTTGPAITAARALVFGVIVAVLGGLAGILLLVFAVRLTTEVLVLIWDGAGVWLTYLLYGLLFTLVGAILFGRRHVRGLD